MPGKDRLKYEKPVSIDMGRVAPILGDTCSVGNGAADCPAGMNNAMVLVCQLAGAGADNDCRTGSNAGTFCWPTGSGALVYCLTGSSPAGAARSYPATTTPESLGVAPLDSSTEPGVTETPSFSEPGSATESLIPETPVDDTGAAPADSEPGAF